MRGLSDEEMDKNAYEFYFDIGEVEIEIDRIVEKKYPERIKVLIRSYVYKIAERKHDYRNGWLMFRNLFWFINSEHPVIADIYKKRLYKLMANDYYSEKIKILVKEIQNVRR